MASFSAVLLAGGQSTRMGRDKAMLPLPDSDLLVWQHQVHLLEQLQPDEFFWSGPARPALPSYLRVVPDEVKNVGPLGGISACLQLLQSDLLLVLAVDLPRMTAPFLQNLLAQSSSARGIVAQHGDFFEPLAAVYPKSLRELAAKHLREKQYALQPFVREAIALKALETFPLSQSETPLFKNLNTPQDLRDL